MPSDLVAIALIHRLKFFSIKHKMFESLNYKSIFILRSFLSEPFSSKQYLFVWRLLSVVYELASYRC